MRIFRAVLLPVSALAIYFAGSASQASAQTRFTSKIVSSTGTPLCLAVRGGVFQNGSTLTTWDCLENDPAQTFYISGRYTKVGASNSPFCVTALDGAVAMSRMGIAGCNVQANGTIGVAQGFTGGAYQDLSSGNLCVDIPRGSNVRGTDVVAYSCSQGASPNQVWLSSRVAPTSLFKAPPTPSNPQVVAPTPIRLAPNASDFISHNGSAISHNGSSLVRGVDQFGHLLDANGGVIAAGGTNNYYLRNENGRLVASGGGNYNVGVSGTPIQITQLVASGAGNLVASGAGNIVGVLVNQDGVPYRLVASGGGNLQLYSPSGSLVASGGGNLVASGAGNLVASGAGNLVASGAGNFVAAAPSYASQLAKLVGQDGSSLIGQDGSSFTNLPALQRMALVGNSGGTLVASGAGNVVSTNGSNILVNNGANRPGYSLQGLGANTAPTGLPNGVCGDAWVTNAIRLVTRKAPNGSGNIGECAVTRYGGGHWTSYPDLVMKVAQASGWPTGGNCRDAWITQATIEVRGVLPAGSGDIGQCDARNYNHGQWANYGVLVGAVKAYYGLR